MTSPAEWTWRGTRVICGDGALADLPARVDALNSGADSATTIGLFTGGSAMQRQGILGRVIEALGEVGNVRTFGGLPPNPQPRHVDEAADFIRAERPCTVVALGGGSVIDALKVANCAAGSDSDALSLLHRKHEPRARAAPRFVAIPTTAGTGSEVTPFATIWDTDAGRKLSLDTSLNRPELAVLDPRATVGMPANLTAQTAADALGHAVESLWSRRRSALSEALSFAALDRIRRALPVVDNDPTDIAARGHMLEASSLAGMAISLTRTAAAHAISYGITLRHGVPHGLAVACLLPSLLRASLSALPEHVVDGLTTVLAAFGDSIEEGFQTGPIEERSPRSPDTADNLSNRLAAALQRTLAYYGMLPEPGAVSWDAEEIEQIAAASEVPGRLDNGVVVPDREQIRAMLAGLRSQSGAASEGGR